jgi:hypothetical protein
VVDRNRHRWYGLDKVPEIRDEIDVLTLPSSEKSQQLITIAIRYFSTLNLIRVLC